jgi:iron only hydrogenase large subunit-like protein
VEIMNDMELENEIRVEMAKKQQRPNLIRSADNEEGQKIAKISLTDCLACSGCVTSAETVLI